MTDLYTSCFWALLSPEHFRFLYLAQAAAKTIIDQDKSIADLLLHRSLFDFIHPDEKRSAQTDLGKFQSTRIPAGSITRCRLRSFKDIAFGHYGSSQTSCTLDSPSPKSEWDVVDVVMYIVTETTILAFFHNPKYFESSGMAQPQCGELTFETQEATKVFDLLDRYMPSSVVAGTIRLFQIHHGNQLRVSWPRQDDNEILEAAKGVMLKEAPICDGNRCIKNTNECTHHHHSSSIAVLSTGMVHVERITIPYGRVIFAAFQFTPISARLSNPHQIYYKHYVHCNPTIVPIQQENLVYPSLNSSVIDFGRNNHPPTETGASAPAADTSNVMSIGKLLHTSTSRSTSSSPTITASDRLARLSVSKSSTAMSTLAPPVEHRVCAKCHTHSSPEWRKGPSGNKTLCNACGLRFSRFIAKQKRLSRSSQKQSSPQ